MNRIKCTFAKYLMRKKQIQPYKMRFVERPTDIEIKDGTLIYTSSGFVLVTKDGWIKGLVKYNKQGHNIAQHLLSQAVKQGGYRLTCFDGYLTKIYLRNGFEIIKRSKFCKARAPILWRWYWDRPDVLEMQLKAKISNIDLLKACKKVMNMLDPKLATTNKKESAIWNTLIKAINKAERY